MFSGKEKERCSARFHCARCPQRAGEQRALCPTVQREGTQRVCISLHTSPAPGFSQQQRLWGQVKPRALPSLARTQFLGPVPKAAALFAQENTAEQRHKGRATLLWPQHSPLIPAWIRLQAGARGTHSSQAPSASPSSFGSGEGKHRSVFFPPLSHFALGQGAQVVPSARTEGAAELLKKWRRDDWGVNKGRSKDAPRGKGWDAASKRVGGLWEEKDWDAARECAGWNAPRGGRKEHGCSKKRRLGWYQRRGERTWMLWGQRAGMVPGKGQGPSVAPGPCSSIQQLHKSRAEHSPPCWPLETFPSPGTGPSLCLPSSDKIISPDLELLRSRG